MMIQTSQIKSASVRNQGEPTGLARIGSVVGEVLSKHGVVGPVAPDADLGRLGMTSIDMVELMLGVEAEFDVAIPADEITLQNFSSVSSIATLVSRLSPTF